MTALCDQCRESPAVTGLAWYTVALLLLFEGCWGRQERYCADCAGGRNFIGLMFATAALLVGFVLLVIFW